ncbi:XkdQ/YqbQ family protein [Cytobacillus gottheilii]|uniref:YqbQ/XkdQ domain-containing protein n=1 Tax=Cytobacillus gottheilii TaxID=859144 RepID=A0ABX8FG56_9BACI|nr:hypothetical protein [Cytobacillus gottheilii]QVY62992.1 hypothetical protein J1899_08110 [Cytobacillus gottheilii]
MSEARISVIYDSQDITQLVESVTWSGSSEKPNRQLDVTLINTLDGRKQAVTFAPGKAIEFSNNGTRLFRGVLFASNIDDRGRLNITAYDENVYLVKSKETRKFTNVKASDIARRLCSDFGIPIGKISDTGYVIPRLNCRTKTLYDILLMALTLTKKQTGKRFFLSSKDGKLNLMTASEQNTRWLIENGSNLVSASYSQSIEDTITQIKVIGGKEDSIVVTQKNAGLQRLYGVMQEVETMDEKATRSQVEQRAQTLLKERGVIDDQATVDALGIDEVISGSAVYVRESMTEIIGGYYVSSDTHTFSANGTHTMALVLSATYDLPPIEIEKEATSNE